MTNESDYSAFFCLRDEKFFEFDHPKYDSKKKEVRLSSSEISILLGECNSAKDVIGVNYPGTRPGTYDVLEIREGAGDTFTLNFLVGRRGGSFLKGRVPQPEVIEILEAIEPEENWLTKRNFIFQHV